MRIEIWIVVPLISILHMQINISLICLLVSATSFGAAATPPGRIQERTDVTAEQGPDQELWQ